MEESASSRRHQEESIRERDSGWRHYGAGVHGEGTSKSRHQGEGIRKEASWGGIIGQASWRSPFKVKPRTLWVGTVTRIRYKPLKTTGVNSEKQKTCVCFEQ